MINNAIKTLTIGRFYPPHHGGVERHIELLLDNLSQFIQADCLVVNNRLRHEMLTLPNRRIILVPAIATIASTPLCPTMPFVARKLYQLHRYDILHLHFPNPMAHLIAYCLPKKIKLVITWHSDIVRQKSLLRFYGPFLRHIIQRADAIVAATPDHFKSSKLLQAWGNSKKFYVVPFGINTQLFTETAAKTAAETIRQTYPNKNLIFALGRHVYYKGFEYLIQAMQAVENTILLLGGTGPLTDDLKKLSSSLNLDKKIIFLNQVSEQELPSYYHAADIFCMPSVEQSEALGLVQMEAMVCKKPVICCELNNGVTYINKNNVTGLVVPPRNVNALATAINTLLDNPKLRDKMGTIGCNLITSEYSLENMGKKTLALYQKLIES